MSFSAPRDDNRVPTLIGVSSADLTTPTLIAVDPTTHRLKVDLVGVAGTVTNVSVVQANGFDGTVANSTSTPAITLKTTITGVLKGNGTAISAATANTDYTPAVMTQVGDIIIGGALGVATRLGVGTATQVLHGGTAPTYSAVVEADITLANNTTNNVSITKHGFAPILPNLTTQFLRGDGAWAVPAGATVPNAYYSETFGYTGGAAHNLVHNFGTFPVIQAFDGSGFAVIPLTIQNVDVNTVAITFTASASYTVVLTIGSPPLTAYTTTSGDYTMQAGDYFIEETGSGKIVTLLTPVGRSGKTVIIKNTSAGLCDVVTAAGTIDGGSDVTLATNDSLSVFSNGTNWLIY